MDKKIENKNKGNIKNHNNNNNKNNEHFFVRLFDIISIPFFILLVLLIIEDQLYSTDFYFEYAIYFGLISGIVSLIMYGYAGYRAKKQETKKIKPYIAGLSLGVLIGVVGFILTVFVSSSFDEQLSSLNQNDFENYNNSEFENYDEFVDESETEYQNGEEFDFENSIKLFAYIFGLIGIIFGGLIGMLCGLIGGKVAQ